MKELRTGKGENHVREQTMKVNDPVSEISSLTALRDNLFTPVLLIKLLNGILVTRVQLSDCLTSWSSHVVNEAIEILQSSDGQI